MPGAHAGCVHGFTVMSCALMRGAWHSEGRAGQLGSARLW